MVDANMMVRELLRLGAYLQREGGRVTREYGLTQQQFVVLVTISEQGPVSQKDIVSDYLLEKSNVSKSVARLEALKLITTRRSEKDSRVVLCELTGQGKRVAEQCGGVFKELNVRWLAGVSQEELAAAWKVLRKLKPLE